ncbi:mucin-17-like [Dermacentor albipictus]|uniref:mucin-17-like n=1 Tax=Dermacentor albipictus TaxID=60249 RepID=UPI0031FC396A
MDTSSLIFSGGRPSKTNAVASLFALTLALGTLAVAAFVLFTAFTGWNNLAVRRQLRVLEPLVAKVPNTNTTRRSRRKLTASFSHTLPHSSPSSIVGNRALTLKDKVSSAFTVAHKKSASTSERTVKDTSTFLARLVSASRQTQNPLLSTPIAHGLLNQNTAITLLIAPERKDYAFQGLPEVFTPEENAHAFRAKETAKGTPSHAGPGHVSVVSYTDYESSAKSRKSARGAPRFSDGSEWPVRELTALPEDYDISRNSFFLGANGSRPRHHNHSQHGQRPIFLPEGPAHEHKIFADRASTTGRPKTSPAPLAIPTPITKGPLYIKTPTRPSSPPRSSETPPTEANHQPTLLKGHDRTVVRIRPPRPTMPFLRPHTHVTANVTDSLSVTAYTYAGNDSGHQRNHIDGDHIRTGASANGQDHEGHVPGLPERSSPADGASLPRSPATLAAPAKSDKVQPTSRTYSFTATTSPRVSDSSPTSIQHSPTTVDEKEPFTEDGETETSMVDTNPLKHDHVMPWPSRKPTIASDHHYGITHRSHVRKLKLATVKVIAQRDATVRGPGDRHRIWKGPPALKRSDR